MNPQIPDDTGKPGWPDKLEDTEGHLYVRIRDGSPVPGEEAEARQQANACMYLRINEDGEVMDNPEVDRMYAPALGSTRINLSMNGGPWVTNEQLIASGCTTWEIPD